MSPEIHFKNSSGSSGSNRRAPGVLGDHLRPAAIAVGVLKEWDTARWGFYNLRQSLASFLVGQGTDPITVQTLLRHADVATTLGIYAHSHSESRMTAQGDMLAALFSPTVTVQ
jgi:integrase